MPKRSKEIAAAQLPRLPVGLHAAGGATGLYLRVAPSGARNWILRVTIGNRRRDMGLGGWPDVPLTEARERARQAREQAREQARQARTEAFAHAQRLREEASRFRDDTRDQWAAGNWGDWNTWTGWSGHDLGALRDFERLARDFVSDLRGVAWESGTVLGSEVIPTLRDILADTLDRIREEVFDIHRDTPPADAQPPTPPKAPEPPAPPTPPHPSKPSQPSEPPQPSKPSQAAEPPVPEAPPAPSGPPEPPAR